MIFGAGALGQLADEVARLGIRRALVLATPPQRGRAERIAAILDTDSAVIFAEAAMHTPLAVTERALVALQHGGADGLVTIGGGSTIGLGKALAVRTGLPHLAIPTTYAGSEMTPILGETDQGVKTTRRDPAILPRSVIYDVGLTLSLPAALSASSGINAMAHAVEALYATDGNPIIALMAEAGIAALARALPVIVRDPQDRAARDDALYGAWLCGACLGAVEMALHHKLCHTLGGSFDLPHAQTHTVILPHVIAYNAQAAPDAMARVARALGSADPARALYDLTGRLGATRALRDLGMKQDDIARAARLACANPYPNPHPVTEEAIRALLSRAWAGEPPQS